MLRIFCFINMYPKNNPATATSVAALKAQTQTEALISHLKRVSTQPATLHALADICDVAQMADAADVARTLNNTLHQLTNVLQIALGSKYQRTDAERLEVLKQHAADIIDEIGETSFLFGQIVEHYAAVDRLYRIIRRAI